ncbi:MAG: hypothetical protein RL518_1910 [Pseudomonadota bacterium]|jgi:hypothetical protein
MDTVKLPSKRSCGTDNALENGWYLLRKNLLLDNRTYRAGTIVEHIDGRWFTRDKREEDGGLSLTPAMVCHAHYAGVSLYHIECNGDGSLYAKPVLSDGCASKVDPMVVQIPLRKGEAQVCVKFGQCFLPLELFNW